MIKSIDTYYKDNFFRSRLEARWAVFFDLIGIQWQYEPKGFVLEDAGCYLPDFYLPELDVYIEVKPDINEVFDRNGNPDFKHWRDHPDFDKWDELSFYDSLIVVFGNPTGNEYYLMHPVDRERVCFFSERGEPAYLYFGGNCANDFVRDAAIAANKKRFEHNNK